MHLPPNEALPPASDVRLVTTTYEGEVSILEAKAHAMVLVGFIAEVEKGPQLCASCGEEHVSLTAQVYVQGDPVKLALEAMKALRSHLANQFVNARKNGEMASMPVLPLDTLAWLLPEMRRLERA